MILAPSSFDPASSSLFLVALQPFGNGRVEAIGACAFSWIYAEPKGVFGAHSALRFPSFWPVLAPGRGRNLMDSVAKTTLSDLIARRGPVLSRESDSSLKRKLSASDRQPECKHRGGRPGVGPCRLLPILRHCHGALWDGFRSHRARPLSGRSDFIGVNTGNQIHLRGALGLVGDNVSDLKVIQFYVEHLS